MHPLGYTHNASAGNITPTQTTVTDMQFQGPLFHFPNPTTNIQNLRQGNYKQFINNLPNHVKDMIAR